MLLSLCRYTAYECLCRSREWIQELAFGLCCLRDLHDWPDQTQTDGTNDQWKQYEASQSARSEASVKLWRSISHWEGFVIILEWGWRKAVFAPKTLNAEYNQLHIWRIAGKQSLQLGNQQLTSNIYGIFMCFSPYVCISLPPGNGTLTWIRADMSCIPGNSVS